MGNSPLLLYIPSGDVISHHASTAATSGLIVTAQVASNFDSKCLTTRANQFRKLFALWYGQKHRDAMPVILIGLPMNVRQVALFKLDRDQNVSRRRNREY